MFWKVINDISRAAAREGKKVSVCGELASDPRYVKKLMQRGVFTVSVSARMISGARIAAMDILGHQK